LSRSIGTLTAIMHPPVWHGAGTSAGSTGERHGKFLRL
jgi:hypothetical protein